MKEWENRVWSYGGRCRRVGAYLRRLGRIRADSREGGQQGGCGCRLVGKWDKKYREGRSTGVAEKGGVGADEWQTG